jgi:hypothetical protein
MVWFVCLTPALHDTNKKERVVRLLKAKIERNTTSLIIIFRSTCRYPCGSLVPSTAWGRPRRPSTACWQSWCSPRVGAVHGWGRAQNFHLQNVLAGSPLRDDVANFKSVLVGGRRCTEVAWSMSPHYALDPCLLRKYTCTGIFKKLLKLL